MKKLFALLFLITLTFSAFSQTYKPMLKENKTWEVDDITLMAPIPEHRYTQYFLLGDSIVNGITYYKVQERQAITNPHYGSVFNIFYNSAYSFSGILLREDSVQRKIWGISNTWQIDSTETLVYDFSLNIGDTLHSSKWHNTILTTTPSGDLQREKTDSAIADSIGITILNNGDTVQVFHLSKSGFGAPFDYTTIIEGIGGWYGFHYPLDFRFESDVRLTCVSKDGINLYGPGWLGDGCGILLSVNESEIKRSIKISPNPNNGQDIIISGEKLENIKTFNLQGQLIKEIETQHEETLLSLENQPKGIYLVKAQFKNGDVVTEKLVLQ